MKKSTKGFRAFGDRSVELIFSFVCNKSTTPGGSVAEGGRQKAVEIAVIARNRRNRKGKNLTAD